jgi:hypothetical protein
MHSGERLIVSELMGGMGRMAGCGAVALLLSAGQALAVDTPPSPSKSYPQAKQDLKGLPAPDAPPTLNADARRLMNRFPGVRPMSWRGNLLGFFGTPMTQARTPSAAADGFVTDHGMAFGAGVLQLEPTWNGSLRDGRHHVFHYAQRMDGLPVEYGRFMILVRTTPNEPWSELHNRVVQAKGRLAARPIGGFKPDLVTAPTALSIVQGVESYGDLTHWSKPTQVVYFGEGDFETWITPVRVWKIVGEIPDSARKFSFFVNCATGEVVHIRGEVHFADVTGTVQAKVTPGSGSDNPANPAVLRPLDDIYVGSGATSTLTNAAGAYTLSLTGPGPQSVLTTVGNGEWVDVFSPQEPTTPILNQTISTLVPGSASFVLNNTPTEFATAHANAFYYLTLTHNYLRALTPLDWTDIDFMLPANVNLTSASGITSCNAFYNGTSTNYFINTGGCNNTAGGSVISHEYGHHIVDRLGLFQGGFGEGFGDTMSMMIFDDPVIGRNFRTDGGVVRLPDSANQQYPCTAGAVHACGQILGGSLWEIRKAYVAFHGAGPGLALVRQQHADWAMITDGGTGTSSFNSANPQTAADWLTVDDTNADADDGSPNYSRLASAYAMHNIPMPALATMDIDLPDGLPGTVLPGASTPIRVRIEAVSLTPSPSTARVFYRTGTSGAFTQSLLTPTGGNEYQAIVPADGCGTVQYYFSVQSTTGVTVTSPTSAPTNAYSLDAVSVNTVLQTSFESGTAGWTTSFVAPSGGTVTGLWTLGDPNATTAQPEDDASAVGTNCWYTGQSAVGAAVGAADVDNGQVILTSPVLDLSGGTDGRVSFWLWYHNFGGSAPDADVFTTQVSSDNGTTWVNADVVGPVTSAGFPGWAKREFQLSEVGGVTPTNQFRIRFIAEDAPSGSVVEAAIDDLLVERLTCATPCPADLDDGAGTGTPDGGVDVSDLLFFLSRFEQGSAAVDLDNDGDPLVGVPDGGVDVNDLLYFLARFEGGC